MDFAERYSSMEQRFIFVTGYFGAPIKERALALTAETGGRYISLDEEIEKRDGRSVLRICMIMGEHEYRNKEYEILSQLLSQLPSGFPKIEADESDPAEPKTKSKPVVVACGDGVLLDEMSAELISRHELVIVGGDMSCGELWRNAEKIKNSCHAFMLEPDENKKRKAFENLYKRQRILFEKFC